MNITERFIPSTDGAHRLFTKLYIPEGEIKGIFHIVHGMTEHIGRYHNFMSAIANSGYICFAFDNLGHGKTAKNDSELGYIAKKSGYNLLAQDVINAADVIRAEFGENLPYYLMGHSMGSFIVRLSSQISAPDKLIVMGTGGSNPLAPIGLAVLNVIKLFFGEKHISDFADSLAFGSYNKRFENDGKYGWLTRDESVRKKYGEDKFCTFRFTVSAMLDLVKLNFLVNKKSFLKKTPASLPILLLSGALDPVGDYGKGVEALYAELKALGANVSMHLYEDARHEILNDTTFDNVLVDILKFIE